MSKPLILTALLSLMLCAAPTAAQSGTGNAPQQKTAAKHKDKAKKQKEKTPAQHADKKGAEAPMFRVTNTGNDYFWEIPEDMLGRQLLVTVRLTSAPANVGKYGGEMVNQQTVYFEKVKNDKIVLRSDLILNVSNSTNAINRAVTISNSNPIIAAFKVEGRVGKAYKVKVSDFFNEDNAAIGLSTFSKKSFGLVGMIPSLSYIESIKSYPMNTEVRTVKTWSAQGTSVPSAGQTGRVTIGLNVSFVLLPEKPMTQRLFDPRVGYFTDSYTRYSDYQQRVEPLNFITRWRLEPKDSADAEKMKRGELVEPKKQIVYYIDPATPKQWRPYLIAGVNDWQKAFEAAGFKNAIVAKEWPDSDKTMSMEDARYSVIRYLASPIENAYGPQVHDPRSGEILESHICWYHNVMKLVHDWYMIQAGNIDEAARQMKYDPELMGQLIRFVSSHEVGHTLGLRHNFGSSSTVPVDSLRDKAWVEAHGHTPSIMDYARFNYVAQPEDNIGHDGIFPRIGDYDVWAIKWGYTPTWNAFDGQSDYYEIQSLFTQEVKQNRRLWFGDGETATTNDSRCQTEDLGDDAVKASTYGIMNLKREVKALPEWTYEASDINSSNLQEVYTQIQGQYLRYMNHVLRNIGGVYKDYGTIDEGGNTYTNVSKARQKECLKFIYDNIICEPTWFKEPEYVKSIYPNTDRATMLISGRVIPELVSERRLKGLNDEYKVNEYLSDLTDYIFADAQPSYYNRDIQSMYVSGLITVFQNSKLDTSYHAASLSTLKEVRKRLASAGGSDVVKAHYEALVDAIDRALVIK